MDTMSGEVLVKLVQAGFTGLCVILFILSFFLLKQVVSINLHEIDSAADRDATKWLVEKKTASIRWYMLAAFVVVIMGMASEFYLKVQQPKVDILVSAQPSSLVEKSQLLLIKVDGEDLPSKGRVSVLNGSKIDCDIGLAQQSLERLRASVAAQRTVKQAEISKIATSLGEGLL